MTADDRTIALSILHEDVRDVATAVLVLKYAQAFYGAEATVAHRLAFNPDFTPSAITVPAGGEQCFDTHGTIVAPARHRQRRARRTSAPVARAEVPRRPRPAARRPRGLYISHPPP